MFVATGGVAATAAVLVVVVGVGSSNESKHAARVIRAELAASVTTSPANGASAVPLDTPVTVRTRSGRLASVSVVASNGEVLDGTLDASHTTWTSSQALGASSTYRVTATVADRSRPTVTTRSSFVTLTPTAWVTMSVSPPNGLSVGVGQPIVLKFTQAITDPAARARLLLHLDTSLSTPVPVGAYWFSNTELHLRSENFWPSGEQIAFSDVLDGWDAGGGMWGQGAGTVQFTTGDARISTANLSTHQMTVTDNGTVVATYPISAGSTQYPTMTGTHVVLDRESQVQMISSTVGIPVNSPGGYDETVYWDVRVSDSGEYVHAAPWSVNAQGSQNVSHGCINLSPSAAQQFFGMSRIGDVINVVGGPRPPVPGDHGVMDWDTWWSSFTPITVTSLSSSPASSPH